MKLKLKGFTLLIIFVLTFLLLRLPSLFEPYWYGDEGIYLVLGQAIRQGRSLYTQIHDNKPPTLYYLAAISKTVFGFRLLLSLWMIPTIYFFYKLSQKFLSQKKALIASFLFLILTSIPFIEGNIANAEIFMLLPTVLAFLVFQADNLVSLFGTGLLLGFAFTFKVPVAIELSALVFYSFCLFFVDFVKKAKLKKIAPLATKLIILSLSFFIPIALLAIYFWIKKALPDFLFASLLQNFSYLSSWKTGSHSGSATQSGIMGRGITLMIFWLICLFLFLVKKIKTKHLFLLVWFSSTIFGALLSTRPYPHYLIQIIPPFCLLLASLFESTKQYPVFIKRLYLALIVFLVYVFYHFDFYTFPSLSYYQAFYKNLNNAQIFQDYFGSHVSQNRHIVDYLSPKLNQQDNIFVWGDAPYIYALLDKLPTDKYTVAYHIVDFDGHQNTIISLKAHLPKFILYYPMQDRPFEQLDHLISKYYFLDNFIDTVLIYQKR